MSNLLKLDLHVHAMLSKSIPFQIQDLNLMLAQAHKSGLSGFALTEHIHAPDYWRTYRLLRSQFEYRCGVFFVEPGFYLINGAEINLGSGGHVLALGEMEAIHALDSRLSLSEGNRPTLSELLEAGASDLLLIGAHPFRPEGGVMKSPASLVKRLGALELNGKDFELEETVRAAARKLKKPLVGGSDAHLWPQIGISFTTLPYCEVSIANLRQHIQDGCVEANVSKDSSFVVSMCRYHKSRIKMLREHKINRSKRRASWRLNAVAQNAAIQLSFI